MKQIRKALAVLLCLVMLTSLLPMQVFAEEDGSEAELMEGELLLQESAEEPESEEEYTVETYPESGEEPETVSEPELEPNTGAESVSIGQEVSTEETDTTDNQPEEVSEVPVVESSIPEDEDTELPINEEENTSIEEADNAVAEDGEKDSVSFQSSLSLTSSQKKNAKTITVGNKYTATISSSDGRSYFYFSPSVTGLYAFTSESDGDTICYVYDGDGNDFSDDDDGGTGRNFLVMEALTAGQKRYYGVGYYSSVTGTFTVKMTKVTGWYQIDDDWYYYQPDGSCVADELRTINGKQYYFDWEGRMAHDIIVKYDGDIYFASSSGALTEGKNNAWNKAGTNWYYIKDGELVEGWLYNGGKWYYMLPHMAASCTVYDSGKYYGFGADGAMAKNSWIKDVWIDADGMSYTVWFRTDSNGVVLTGWKKIDGKWYYFDKDNGVMYADGIYEIGGKQYYFDTSGAMRTGWIKKTYSWTDEVDWLYAYDSGVMVFGWEKIGGKWYYFDEWGYMYYDRAIEVDGEVYFFSKSGALTGAGWQKLVNSDGKTEWYYVPKANGPVSIGWKMIDYQWYYFDSWGVMQTSWQLISGKWYYFGSSGAMVTGWQLIGSKWYYFEDSGVMLCNTSKNIGGVIYHFNSSGVCTDM